MGEEKDTMAAYRVWEYDYEVNRDRARLLDEYYRNPVVRHYAMPVTYGDATSLFSTTYDITLPVPDSLRSNKHLFLCRFHDWHWEPIRDGIVEDDSVRFRNATIRQWYRLAYATADSVMAVGTPFTIVGNKGITKVNDRIRPYDLTGDTILFNLVYYCKTDEARPTRQITTNYWDKNNQWHPYTGTATLWGVPSTRLANTRYSTNRCEGNSAQSFI